MRDPTNPAEWMSVVGNWGIVHRVPTDEEHHIDPCCVCNPVEYRYPGGGHIFIHRVLSC